MRFIFEKASQLPKIIFSALFLSLFFGLSGQASAASLPCGNITGPLGVLNFGESIGSDIRTVEVSDCANPFNVTTNPVSPYTLEIDGLEIQEGETYIQHDSIQNIFVLGSGVYNYVERFLFKHEGEDYIFLNESVPEPTPEEYRAFASTYFASEAEADRYIAILIEDLDTGNVNQYFVNEAGEDLIDADTGEYVSDRYYSFRYSANNYLDGRVTQYEIGTYTMVIKESELTLSYQSIWDDIREYFIKTAHAYVQSYSDPNFYTITFTIADPLPEVVGASNVLFLPGIQASRLYKDGLFGTEDQLWEPNFNQDVAQLAMTETGESINVIYTEDVVDTVFGLGDIYAGFLDFLEEQKTAELPIKDFTAFAYDWRFSVEDVAVNGTKYENETKSLVAEVERLAEGSYTKKVTLIAHSNGGLLAKALIRELENSDKSDLVDLLILLASPQIGTPKAIGTVLHGYDQQDSFGGFFISAATARKSINNMPGAYGLLPSEKYFSDLEEPMVTFGSGTTTQDYINEYGEEISSYYDYVKFIGAADNIDRDLNHKVSVPANGNRVILGEALDMHDDRLDSWVAPANIKVIEIVGTGLPTMKSIEYREITEQKCASSGGGIICVDENEIKPFAHMTKYGDGTVVQKSAEAYPGDKKKYFVNLRLLETSSEDTEIEYAHSNITESIETQSLIKSLISSSTYSSEFISNNYTVFDDVYDVETIDSPVRLLATDAGGNQTGVVIVNGQRVIKQDIPGSQYFEFGDTKYFIVPSNTERTTKLYGEDYGGYTLTISSIDADDKQTKISTISNSSTTPSLVAEYGKDGEEYSSLVTDIDGDGVEDYEMTLNGDLIQGENEVSYEALIGRVNSLSLPRKQENLLLLFVKKAEKYSNKVSRRKIYLRLEKNFLNLTGRIIKQYNRKGYISDNKFTELDNMIKKLKDK